MKVGKDAINYNKALNNLELFGNEIAGKDGTVTIAVELFLKDYYTFFQKAKENGNGNGESELEDVVRHWTMAMRNMGYNVIFHRQDIFYPVSGTPIAMGNSFLERSQKEYYNTKNYMKHRSLLFITKVKSGMFNSYVSGDELLEFRDKVSTFLNIIDGVCIKGHKILSTDEYIDYLQSMVSLDFSKDPDKKKIMLDADFVNAKIGDYFIDSYQVNNNEIVVKTPQTHSINGFLSNVDQGIYCHNSYVFPLAFGVDAMHIMNNIIIVPDQREIITNCINAEKTAEIIRAPYISTESKEYRMELNEGEESRGNKIGVKHHFSIHVFSKDQAHRDRNRRSLERGFNSVFGNFYKITFNQDELWVNTIGNGASRLTNNDAYLTYLEEAACYNNWEGETWQSTRGVLWEDRNGMPVVDDLTYEPKEKGVIENYNSVIVGPPGAGKSVTVQKLMYTQYCQGQRIIMLDLGRSHKNFCMAAGGTYISFEKAEDLALNPFQIPLDEIPDEDFFGFIKDLLITCWGKDELDSEGDTTLQKIIGDFYKWRQNERIEEVNFDVLYHFIEDRNKQKEVYDYKYLNLDKFLHVTNKYTLDGKYKTLLNGTSRMDIVKDRLVVIEMEEIKKDKAVFSIVIAVLLDFISRQIKSDDKNLLQLYADEAWSFFDYPKLGNFFVYAVKTFRKKGAGVNIIVQAINDLLKEKNKNFGLPILTCSDSIYHLKPNNYDVVRQGGSVLGLSKKMIDMVCSLKTHEIFIRQGQQGMAAMIRHVRLSKEEFVMFNSDKENRKPLENAIAENNGNVELAVSQRKEEMFENK